MSSHLQQQLQALSGTAGILTEINRGIEKESLRICADGTLAQTPHPAALGSALSHPSITTDYSESLMEFITPVSTGIEESLETLEDVHSYVYQNVEDEILWCASMPCIMSGDENIPVARYGSSNVARMKTVYRYGLGHRYGRLMQTIAGIHYNFSMPDSYWQLSWEAAGKPGNITDYISERYLGLIRNFRRYSWLLVYLYGASPAVCASFLRGRSDHTLVPFEPESRSLHKPYGTALRMGGLGYSSDAQNGLDICYNSLDNYVETLGQAILTPHRAYADIPSGQDGNYQQLNDSLLQIENEFYSPIRPKRVAYSGETPLGALRRGGIEYIEVRCVDVSPFSPVGLDADQIRFMDTFLLYCLFAESPPCDEEQQLSQAANLEAIVERGRDPALMLRDGKTQKPFGIVATNLLNEMAGVAELLNEASGSTQYSEILAQQAAKVEDPQLTPSARILREMEDRKLPFFRLAMEYSQHWAQHFRNRNLEEPTLERYQRESVESLAMQAELEQADAPSFEEYLRSFYAQYHNL